MKRVSIVCAGAVRNMVMVSMYTNYLTEKRAKYSYDMIYMDKYYESEETGAEVNYRYEYDGKSVKGKVLGYSGFVLYASKILKKENYDYIIVWGELTAVLLYDTLKKHYKGKYCVNIRDLFVGKRRLLNNRLNKSVLNADFVTVSSNKYLEELPANYKRYYFVHSFNDEIMRTTKIKHRGTIENKRITILYIGNVRFYDHLYKLISEIQNDDRFEVKVVGVGSEPVREYVIKNGILNVDVEGAFLKERTSYYLEQADVIYNLYGTEDINLRMALSNKLYYAVCLNVPILVYKDTYMYEISSQCGIGFAFDEKKDKVFADAFYNWYTSRDCDKSKKLCDDLIKEARSSQKRVLKRLEQSINNGLI